MMEVGASGVGWERNEVLARAFFYAGERCGGGVCPHWHVGGPLGVLEEGIEWLARLRVNGIFSSQLCSTGISHSQQDPDNPFLRLLSEYPAVTQASVSDCPVKYNVTHHIKTTGPPVFTRTRQLALERLRIARQEFEHTASSALRPAVGRPLCTWSPNARPGIGGHVGTIAPSTTPLCPIGIQSHIFRISRPPSKGPRSSPGTHVSPNTCGAGRHPQNCYCHTLRPLQVPPYTVWSPKRRSNFQMIYGRSAQGPAFLLRVCG